jgi:hypothetical protein
MFHLHVRYLSRDGGGSCESARQYVVRAGRFRNRGDAVRLVRSLHMPQWAKGDSAANYWAAAEGGNARVNARTALLIVFALPRNLLADAQDELALQMAQAVAVMCGTVGPRSRLPVTWAIHEGYGRNPHVHMLVSTSVNDGIARPAELWFKRYSPDAPSKGGAPRSRFLTQRVFVFRVRETWARLANAALRAADLPADLDHRSFAVHGLVKIPSLHMGPRLSKLKWDGPMPVRAARNLQIAEENKKALEQEEDLARRQRELRALEIDARILVTARAIWNSYKELEWRTLLKSHPLAGDADQIRRAAAVMLLEGDRANFGNLRGAYDSIVSTRGFVDRIGPGWDAVTTSTGIWAVRPGDDGVVMLGPGYVLTDACDPGAVATLLSVSSLLPFSDPVVRVRPDLPVELQAQLSGLDWKGIRTTYKGKDGSWRRTG